MWLQPLLHCVRRVGCAGNCMAVINNQSVLECSRNRSRALYPLLQRLHSFARGNCTVAVCARTLIYTARMQFSGKHARFFYGFIAVFKTI